MSTQPIPLPDPAASLALPSHIGKYRVLKRLGEGATAEVYLCHDDFKGQDVAIKRVRAKEPGDPTGGRYSDRFFAAEAALVGRLNHPNVVQIFDAVPDPVAPYLVMEYVAGSTLRPYCRADQLLSLELVVEIGFKCAMALGYVYRQGLIHRDVKPANLLAVLNNGAITDVKISDFGSVLNLGSDVTQIYRVGSLAYMSPEQLDGDTLDCRADMYSLGAVLYHLIAGRPPFDAQVQSAMMQQIYHVQPGSAGRAARRRQRRARRDRAARARQEPGRALRQLGGVRAGAVGPDHQPAGAARPVAGRARFGALQPAAHARVLRELRRRRALGGRAPREVAALPFRPRAVPQGRGRATAFTSSRRARSRSFATARRSRSSAPARRSARWPTSRRAPSSSATAPT